MKTVNLFLGIMLFCMSALAQNDTSGTDAVFLVVEKMPEFPGGNNGMFTFISENVVYPEYEKIHHISGTCYVSFIVEKDGSVTDSKVIRGVGNGLGCDQEALRVMKLMPNWSPGMQNGRPVRTRFNLPIKFTLREPK